MSSLATTDKQVLEKLLQMEGGYVLNFSDRTFREFFRDDIQVEIYDQKFNYSSGSKANRMRGFWQVANDTLVGKTIDKLTAYIDTQILLGRLHRQDFPEELIRRGQAIAARLLGSATPLPIATESEFIAKDYGNVSIDKLALDPAMNQVLKQRIEEIRKCLTAKAPLAVIFLCGSSLEGILLGIACLKPNEFNGSKASPKDRSGSVKSFPNWTLNDFINVASDLKLVREDVKKFSHGLRDFRNYIHPHQQMSTGFDPDEHTAKICWQVLQAAITQLSS